MKLWISTITLLALFACTQENTAQMPETPMPPDPETTEAPERIGVLSWGDLLSQEKPSPSVSIRIGEGDTDIVDLWLPETPGPHPVVLMVHGGCWQKAIADRTLMNFAAEDLRQRGLAVWNVEYRGVDEDGGGYPGTYLDVARAADALRGHAETHDLDLKRIAGMGHSAGGHLVTWLATRPNLETTSPLYMEDPLRMVGAINTGGLADLAFSARVTQADCLGNILGKLTGEPSAMRADVFSDTSPAELLPIPGRHISLNADLDRIAPPGLARAFAAKDRAADGSAEAMIIPGNNHVDLIAPGTAAWEAQAILLQEMLGED